MGGYSFVECLCLLTVDRASFRDGAPAAGRGGADFILILVVFFTAGLIIFVLFLFFVLRFLWFCVIHTAEDRKNRRVLLQRALVPVWHANSRCFFVASLLIVLLFFFFAFSFLP